MKTLAFLFLAAWSLRTIEPAQAETLRVVIGGIENSRGVVNLSLEDSEKSYYGDKEPLKVTTVDAAKGEVEISFTDLPPGTYSIKAFHDENANSKLDLSIIGIPKESYGISNNARAALGMPSYNDAKFDLAGDKTMHVQVKKHISF